MCRKANEMKFETLGQKGKPTVVCIHGMFADANAIKPFAEFLADEYYVVLPTLNGHCMMSADFHNPIEEAQQIYDYLESQGITELSLVQGTTLGATVALAMAYMNKIPCKSYFMDSPQLYKYGRLRRSISYAKIQTLLNQYRMKADTSKQLNAGEELEGTATGKILGTGEDAYSGMVQGTAGVYNVLTDSTIRNCVDACYNFTYPELPVETQLHCVFFFGAKDPSAKQEKEIKKHYPKCIVNVMSGHSQGTFQILNPEKYASMLKMGIY